MRKPLVSICIPNFNNAKYLVACINSALNQIYPNKEIILIDDASSDKSWKIARKFSKKIKIFRNKTNLGQPKNTNKCVAISRGKYIAILHSDDLLLPDFAEKLVPILEKNNSIGMAVGERIITDENEKRVAIAPFYNADCVIPGVKQAKVFMMTSFLPCQVLCRKKIFEQIGGVDEQHIVNLDGLLWFKFALRGDVAYIRHPVSVYRIHSEQTTAQYNRTINHMMEYYGTLVAMFRLGHDIPYLKRFFPDAVRRVAELTIRYCYDVLRNKDFGLARRYLVLATVFDSRIIKSDAYGKIQKCLNLTGKAKNSALCNLFVSRTEFFRKFSYSPPKGSKKLP